MHTVLVCLYHYNTIQTYQLTLIMRVTPSFGLFHPLTLANLHLTLIYLACCNYKEFLMKMS